MRKPIVFMYSGQGAQFYQMGKELYETDPVFRKWFDQCADHIEPQIGASLSEILFRERANKFELFDRTLYTHPANVIFAYAMTQALYHRGIRPDFLLGYSLGEYTSAVVSGVISLEDGLNRVVAQAKLLEENCQRAGMMAILDTPDLMNERPGFFSDTWLACHNFENHFVVTGYIDHLKYVEEQLVNEGTTAQVLPISHGFHSPLIEPIREASKTLFTMNQQPTIPVWSSCLTHEIQTFDGEHFWQVIRKPVLFLETLKRILQNGPHTFIDVGPSATMATFVKYIIGRNSDSDALLTVNQFGRDTRTMEALENKLRNG